MGNDVVIITKTSYHMVDQLIEDDVNWIQIQSGIDTTEKTQLLEPSKLLLVSENGLKDTCLNALDKRISISKSTEWADGTTNFKLTWPTTKTKSDPSTVLYYNTTFF